MNQESKITVELTKKSDHGGSVRFDAPKPAQGQKPNPIQNVYVSRILPWINDAQKITITIELAP